MVSKDNYQQLIPNFIHSKMGEVIGSGQDGIVYQYENNKVIKICHIDVNNPFQSNLENVLTVLSKQEYLPYAKIYDYGFIGQINNYNIYYYVMDKLNSITDDEWKVFHSILSHEDRNIVKNYSLEKLEKILYGLGRGLDFDVERVKLFCVALKKSPIKHLDLHPRNILKNNLGFFKLVDFNRITMENI